MRAPLISLALLAVALSPAFAKEKAASPAEVSCTGAFAADSSEARLIDAFGKANVTTGMVPGPEGMEMLATTVFPDDPEKTMRFGWWDEDKREYLSYVDLAPSQSAPRGVRQGMSVAEIEAINGAPFSLNGFWWDYGGYAWFETGVLAPTEGGCSLMLRFDSTGDVPEGVDVTPIAGDITVPSGEALLKTLDVRVSQVSLGYPLPDDTD